jgi:hypothetical protein
VDHCVSLCQVSRVRTARETARDAAGKRIVLGENATVHLDNADMPKGPRKVPTVMVYLALLEVLLVGGYAMVGNFVQQSSGKLWCSLQVVRGYLSFLREKAAPLNGSLQPLHLVRKSDEDTRVLWAEKMRQGLSFDEAVTACEAKVAALWLWTTLMDVEAARQSVAAGDATGSGPNFFNKGGGQQWQQNYGQHQNNRSGQKRQFEEWGKTQLADSFNNQPLCKLWNEGKCSSGDCKHSRQHLCNFLSKQGKPCGQKHRRCEKHWGNH